MRLALACLTPTMDHFLGQRLSLKGQLCTVRYIGPVTEKSGDWLGVEWDDTARGKHNGMHDGKQYFECLYSDSLNSKSPRLQLTTQAEARPPLQALS